MAHIFSASRTGCGIVFSDPELTPITVSLTGWGNLKNAIIQNIRWSSQSSAQFLRTTFNHTYVYIFGEKLGDISLTGKCFARRCWFPSGSDGEPDPNIPSGFSQLGDYYRVSALSQSGMSGTIIFGYNITHRAFMVGCTLDFNDPNMQMGNFELSFKVV